MPRAKTRTPQRRDHVVQVALDTLAKEGVAGFTTRKVAADAATSTPAVYELFGDKAGLVRELFFEGFRLLRRHYDEARAGSEVRELIVGHVRRGIESGRLEGDATDIAHGVPQARCHLTRRARPHRPRRGPHHTVTPVVQRATYSRSTDSRLCPRHLPSDAWTSTPSVHDN